MGFATLKQGKSFQILTIYIHDINLIKIRSLQFSGWDPSSCVQVQNAIVNVQEHIQYKNMIHEFQKVRKKKNIYTPDKTFLITSTLFGPVKFHS